MGVKNRVDSSQCKFKYQCNFKNVLFYNVKFETGSCITTFKINLGIHKAEEYKNMNILPSANTNRVLVENFKVLIARTLVSFLPAFKQFTKQVTRHIDHPFKNEMSSKSEVVSDSCNTTVQFISLLNTTALIICLSSEETISPH